jgi:hypothetical protein
MGRYRPKKGVEVKGPLPNLGRLTVLTS